MITTKEKYEKYRPKKFLGQNFLVDENIARKIVAAMEIKDTDTVVEIGPGQGVLTKYLCMQTKFFYAVEIDRHIAEKLSLQFADKFKLIHKDFLKLDLNSDIFSKGKLKIIGNIPYNITSEILFKLFDINEKIDTAVLMMQKEVAKRLTALPDTKDYGILAIQTQFNSDARILFNVPPTAFFPKPRVDSSIVRLKFKEPSEDLNDKKLFGEIIKESFGKRRKTMRNSLKKFFESHNISPDDVEFDFSRRPESVSINEFTELTNRIDAAIKTKA